MPGINNYLRAISRTIKRRFKRTNTLPQAAMNQTGLNIIYQKAELHLSLKEALWFFTVHHHDLLIHCEEKVFPHSDQQRAPPHKPSASASRGTFTFSGAEGGFKKHSRSVQMNFMSHWRIICESLVVSVSQRLPQTHPGFGSLVGNEAYFPEFSAAIFRIKGASK